MAETVVHQGGCHCGKVRFEVRTERDIRVEDCNCSICSKVGYLHLIVPRSSFYLVSGEEDLVEYRFNTGTARHLFCGTCGVKPFYVPRSHPDGWSVNARCLDPETLGVVTIVPFDGSDWEANASSLPPLEDS